MILFLKKLPVLLIFQQVVFPVPTLLHDFCPLVERRLLVCEHDEGLLLQAEIATTRLLAVDRGLLDDPPVDLVLDLPSFQLPDVS